MSLTARIKAHARGLGFAGVGVVPVGPSLTHGFYRRWLARGYAGDMGYLHRHAALKADPDRLAPGARSLIVLSSNYLAPAPPVPAQGGPRGRISRYAWGRDYHRVLQERLEELADFIRHASNRPVRAITAVDTKPLMEREFAARAGLGWVGRNGCLIDWEQGSWLFLAGLLVDVALQPDGPVPPRPLAPPGLSPPDPPDAAPPALRMLESCGSCTACIAACPTGAIVADRTVDSRRCISYHTIELKGPIPPQWREALGNWVFGCDICQDVCPWNRQAPLGGDEAFAPGDPPAERAWPSLAALLALDERGFRERFQNTAVARTRRRGLLRNAAIALGNAGAEGAAPAVRSALCGALADAEPLVRGAAAWALGCVGGPAGRAALRARLALEPDAEVREEVRAALAEKPGTG